MSFARPPVHVTFPHSLALRGTSHLVAACASWLDESVLDFVVSAISKPNEPMDSEGDDAIRILGPDDYAAVAEPHGLSLTGRLHSAHDRAVHAKGGRGPGRIARRNGIDNPQQLVVSGEKRAVWRQ